MSIRTFVRRLIRGVEVDPHLFALAITWIMIVGTVCTAWQMYPFTRGLLLLGVAATLGQLVVLYRMTLDYAVKTKELDDLSWQPGDA